VGATGGVVAALEATEVSGTAGAGVDAGAVVGATGGVGVLEATDVSAGVGAGVVDVGTAGVAVSVGATGALAGTDGVATAGAGAENRRWTCHHACSSHFRYLLFDQFIVMIQQCYQFRDRQRLGKITRAARFHTLFTISHHCVGSHSNNWRFLGPEHAAHAQPEVH